METKIMDVTRKNFKEKFPEVANAIHEASFISIDLEFSGLHHEQKIHALDTPEERYQKLRQGSANFQIMQFGICTFKHDPIKNSHEAKAYNFYVFPKPFSRQAPDRRFLCQSSSLDFLASHGFDFNKWIYEGIPYLPHSEENKLRQALKQRHEKNAEDLMSSPAFTSPAPDGASITKGPTDIPEEQKPFIEDICKKVEDFVQERKPEEDSLDLDPCSAFQRKLIYQTIKLRFSSSVHLESKTNDKKQRYIIVSRVDNEEERRKKEESRKMAELEELEDAVGFSNIIKLLTQSTKLIVGHNMLLDVLHSLHHFSCDLPEEYSDFKSVISCVYPRLVDTKLMANTAPFKENILNSALGDLYKCVQNPPFARPDITAAEGFEKYTATTEPLHEAGYDAFITGVSFIAMSNYLGIFKSPTKPYISPTSQYLHPFVNKINLMRVVDVPYINLEGQDLQPSRDHCFHVTFPSDWKSSDLWALFNPFGNIQVNWIDETSAFIVLYKRDEAASVLRQLNKGQGDVYRIMTYNDYKKFSANAQRKRPRTPESDVDLPSKKTKALNAQASPFQSRYSITPIPEEDSEESEEDKNNSDEAMQSDERNADTQSTDDKKLFEEPDTW